MSRSIQLPEIQRVVPPVSGEPFSLRPEYRSRQQGQVVDRSRLSGRVLQHPTFQIDCSPQLLPRQRKNDCGDDQRTYWFLQHVLTLRAKEIYGVWTFRGRPKGENRTAQGFSPGRRPRENRPERAAEWRASFPEITFIESDSMAFQKLTKLFLIRKFAVMLGLIGNVGADSLYVRLAH